MHQRPGPPVPLVTSKACQRLSQPCEMATGVASSSQERLHGFEIQGWIPRLKVVVGIGEGAPLLDLAPLLRAGCPSATCAAERDGPVERAEHVVRLDAIDDTTGFEAMEQLHREDPLGSGESAGAAHDGVFFGDK